MRVDRDGFHDLGLAGHTEEQRLRPVARGKAAIVHALAPTQAPTAAIEGDAGNDHDVAVPGVDDRSRLGRLEDSVVALG